MYIHSESQSTTSLSDNDEDDNVNKSTFFQEPVAVSPAQWSHPRRTSSASSKGPIIRLPMEIIIHALRYFHSPRDLYRCMLVCRTWCECSVELLWHKPSFPNVGTLIKMMRILSSENQSFTYARFIRRLNFLFLGRELSDVLFARVAQCVRLERLTLVNCENLSDDAMTRVFHWFPCLVAIDLTGVVEASDRAVVALASASKRLQGINLAMCKKVTDRGITALARNCPLLRRVKLSGLELITDEAVIALARGCSLMLEIDLNHCSRVTDRAARELWMCSFHMREMRLAHCEDLTDLAFPAPAHTEFGLMQTDATGPFPHPSSHFSELPPLRMPRRFEHLRMLDLTSCGLITDDAVEGIIANAPKIRNLVLAKCSLLTDRSVDNICKLGKSLHYLHLGHCSSITDSSVKNLARSCTRLRYIDLANCTLLTDMAVFELSGLPKLRRIGLVRVHSLTDEAIYALGDRHATLERIHLSYCNHISLMSIHFLLQRLMKLTHLSLTGIPAFRSSELQRFCRSPPPDFNSSQRAAFCVFSGKGVSDLREALKARFHNFPNNMQEVDPTTEFELDDPATYGDGEDDVGEGYDGDFADGDVDAERERMDDGDHGYGLHYASSSGTMLALPAPPIQVPSHMNLVPLHENGSVLSPLPPPALPPEPPRGAPPGPSPPIRRSGFGETPLVEAPASPPPPSDTGSFRSSGTNASNGAGFFRTYIPQPSGSGRPSPTSRGADGGTQTPDLIFAEIGHGRGMGHVVVPPVGPSAQYGSFGAYGASAAPLDEAAFAQRQPHTAPPWVRRTSADPSPPSSSALEPASSSSSLVGAPMAEHGSSRAAKRTFRSTLSAASHLFGRGSGDGSGRSGGLSADTQR